MSGFTYGGENGAQYGGENGGLYGLPLLFPPQDFAVSTVGTTSADLTWTDNNPDEYAVGIQRAKFYDDVEAWGPWRGIDVVDPNTEAYTDDTVQQGWQYRWRVYASNLSGRAFSNEDTGRTTDSDARDRSIPTTRPHVEIDHPDSPTPLTPEPLEDGFQASPTANGLPRVEVPVERDEKWQAEAFTEAPMRVWVDGDRLPIDTLVNVRMEAGRTILVGRGGSELLDRVEREVSFADAHGVARDLIETTGYVANVDDPAADVDEDVTMFAAATQTDWTQLIADGELADDVPAEVTDDGRLRALPTAQFVSGEDMTATGGSRVDLGSYEGGSAYTIGDLSESLETTVQFDHDIPADSVGFAFRFLYSDDTHPAVDWQIDGESAYSTEADSDFAASSMPFWAEGSITSGITAGESVTVKYALDDTSDIASDESGMTIDCICVYDQRYTEPLVEDDLTDGGALSWPNLGPDAVAVETQDFTTPFVVVGGGVDAAVDNTETNQALQVSNDQGQNWYPQDGSEANTDSVDVDFPDDSPQVRAQITLSYYETGGNAGTTLGGIQSVDTATLFADLDDTPTLANRTFDGQLKDVLAQIAEDRNFVWEVRWDSSQETMSVEWTQPGQRFDGDPVDVSNYSIEKQTEDLVEQLTVYGSSQRRTGETFTAVPEGQVGPNDGVLENTNLVELKEAVTDADGNQYARNEDYEISYLDGEIWIIDTGGMTDGETYEIDYEYKTQGAYPPEDDAPSDARENVERIMGLGSSRICEQTAYYIVQRTSEPVWEGTISLPKQEVGWSVVDEINPEKVPTAGNRLEVVSIDETPGSIDVKIRSRRTLGELVSDLSSGLESVKEVS